MTELQTERLRLRLFRNEDARAFVALAGDPAVARMTSDIPYPLTEADAAPWLRREPGEVRFAIEYQGELAGGAGYFRRPSGAAELGFWIGRRWWGLGFATEATRAVVRYGFAECGLQAFSSSHFVDNAASERVLLKLGFQPMGRGAMWCVARRSRVDVVEYWLSRPAEDRPATKRIAAGRWLELLGRMRRPVPQQTDRDARVFSGFLRSAGKSLALCLPRASRLAWKRECFHVRRSHSKPGGQTRNA